MHNENDYPLGAHRFDDGSVHFLVWAPQVDQLEVHLLEQDIFVPLKKDERGYHAGLVADVAPGERYFYRLDGEKERPDPTSRLQPDGVHGPSAVVSGDFAWNDAGWKNPPLRNTVFYELHVGTFTPDGTFDAIIPHLAELRELGITTIELMPVAQFPGARNWGYDGVNIYAPHSAYGGPDGLKSLVNAAHQEGLAVFLDVVYNHLGPEGNYLWDYGPYFTDRYHTPWGSSFNLDGPHSDEVRRYFIENARYWLEEFHIDGLRLDATHALFDFSAVTFLEELATTIHRWAANAGRQVYLIAETDRSDRRTVMSRALGGLGLDGQWLDDLHHALHYALTGETDGYYEDYQDFGLMHKVLAEGFAYSGQYSPHRQRKHGTSSENIDCDKFVVCTENHDQVGNRMLGERKSQLTDFEGLKLSAGLLLTSPYVPLLFMGQEYGETAPFLYFVSHGDKDLVEAVRQGRAAEFASFEWKGTPPDPQAETTFIESKLNHNLKQEGWHRILYSFYRALLDLRHSTPALTNPERDDTEAYSKPERLIYLERRSEEGDETYWVVMNFHLEKAQSLRLPVLDEQWTKIFDSSAAEWQLDGRDRATAPDVLPGGSQQEVSLPPRSFVIYYEKQ
jgi:maltooligosyltrehalose trehalohydrolase